MNPAKNSDRQEAQNQYGEVLSSAPRHGNGCKQSFTGTRPGAKVAPKAVIRENPKHFAVLCLKRVYYFWFSVPHPFDEGVVAEYGRNLNFQFTSIAGLLGLALALRRRIPGAVLFAWAFFLLPLVYYFVTVHARFRHPLEPLIAILSVYLFQSAEKSWRVRWFVAS